MRQALGSLFPFYIETDADLRVISCGQLLMQSAPWIQPGEYLFAYVDWLSSRRAPIPGFDLARLMGKSCVLYLRQQPDRALRGCWHRLESTWLYLGWPVVSEEADLQRWGLQLSDFPAHYPLEDMLLLLVTAQNTIKDSRALNQRLKMRATQLEAANKALAHQAYHDALTGLPNRVRMREQIDLAIEQAHATRGKFAIVFIDLDFFKLINDQYGHATGDEVLQLLARRLASVLGEGDLLGRESGDEFVVLIRQVTHPADVGLLVGRLQQQIVQPCQIGGREIHVGACIGVALYPQDGDTTGQLILGADVAMLEAKHQGRGGIRYRSAIDHAKVMAGLVLADELRNALDRGELFLEYQPVVELSTRRMIGAEALLRWAHPQRGRIPPDVFIPLAEEAGLMSRIGEWVLHTACRQAAQWPHTMASPGHVAVNLSAVQLRDDQFIQQVATALRQSGLAANRLVLELTETGLLADPTVAQRQFATMREMGIRLAIDDFGIGYSSLSMVSSLPFDILKLDRSFVSGSNAMKTGMLHTILDMARHLGLEVVAEGIETPAQHALLCAESCRWGQGYWYARPMSSADLCHLMASMHPLPSALPPVSVTTV